MDIIYQIIITKLGITSNSNTKEHRYTVSAIHLILWKYNVYSCLMYHTIDPSPLNFEAIVKIKTFPIHYQKLEMNTILTK